MSLTPGTPSYIRALNTALRASLEALEDYLKKEKQRRKRSAKEVTEKREEDMDSDDEMEDKSYESEELEKCNEGEEERSQSMVKLSGSNMGGGSDGEYEELARRVWERTQRTQELAGPDESITNSDKHINEEHQNEPTVSDDDEAEDQEVHSQEPFPSASATTDDNVIILTDSDRAPDGNYMPSESSETQESLGSEQFPSEDTASSQELRELLIGVVEVIDRQNCEPGSFLDGNKELPCKAKIQEFIRERESEGYRGGIVGRSERQIPERRRR